MKNIFIIILIMVFSAVSYAQQFEAVERYPNFVDKNTFRIKYASGKEEYYNISTKKLIKTIEKVGGYNDF